MPENHGRGVVTSSVLVAAAASHTTIELSRWQFASTTIFHFFFVPLSIGLALVVAGLQTAAYRAKDEQKRRTWDRATRFWGKIMLVSFAVGVVTGIVQEFQFGMNWSAYSRYVGDIFGAPLAMEGLIAFFLESTFLGLWVFGRDRLSPRLHLMTAWLFASGTVISAYFILAANSWMQHPVGWRYDPVKNRATLTSIWAVLFNSTQLVTFPHVVLGALTTGGAIVSGVSAWHLRRRQDDLDVHQACLKVGAVMMVTAGIAVAVVGHFQGQVMTRQQPMKMAAAEALWDTRSSAPFSLFAVGDVSKGQNKVNLSVPDGLSMLATDTPSGRVEGVNDLQAAEAAKYGPGDYRPNIAIAYWSFRFMIGFGALAALVGAALLVQLRRHKLDSSRRLLRVAIWATALPFLANTAGWLFTETARQPWLVYGVLQTKDGVSPNVGPWSAGFTLLLFTGLYTVLGVIAYKLIRRISREGVAGIETPEAPTPELVDSTPVFG
jgi:cytochrome d ubiquinol oxidase subunit I